MSAAVAELVRQVERIVVEAARLRPEDLGADTTAYVGLVFADTVGVIAAGARSAEVAALAADPSLALGTDGAARALTPGTPRGTPLTVAWLNGTAGTFLELDEGFRPTGHPAVQVVPAALAVAEATGASGQSLVRAVVAGYEVAARLFESFRLPAPMHPHGHFGALGAATAVALLQDEDPVELVRLAATQPLLTGWEACYEGATARNTWAGHANRAAVLASVLRRAGLTGSLASHLSVVAPYAAATGIAAEPVEPGTVRIRRNYLKFHSACALTHAALDAALEARSMLADPDPDPARIREVEVVTVSNNLRVARQPRPNPLSTRFSLPYAVAAALVTGGTGPSAFGWRADIAALASRVRVSASPELDAGWPAVAPASVRVVTTSGSVRAEVRNPRGHHEHPATRAQIRDKFVGLGGTAAAFEALAAVAERADCATLPLGAVHGRGDPTAGVATNRADM